MSVVRQVPIRDSRVALRVCLATLILLFFQWIMAYCVVPVYARVDLFLYLVVSIAAVMKPLGHLLFAIVLGYLLDTLSGRLWGFHIATYVCAVAFIHLTSNRAEMRSLLYQLILTGFCALIQGGFIVFFVVNSYEFFPDVLGFVTSFVVPRVLLTIGGSMIVSTFLFAWFTGESRI